MHNKSTLLLLTLSVAVFGVITTEIAVIGLLPGLVLQLHVTPVRVGLLVSIYAIVVAVTGPFITLSLSGFNKRRYCYPFWQSLLFLILFMRLRIFLT